MIENAPQPLEKISAPNRKVDAPRRIQRRIASGILSLYCVVLTACGAVAPGGGNNSGEQQTDFGKPYPTDVPLELYHDGPPQLPRLIPCGPPDFPPCPIE